MKKGKVLIGVLVAIVVLVIVFLTVNGTSKDKVFKIGATPVPHTEILNFVADDFKAKTGVDLKIIEFTDYVQPNLALEDGSIDANFFQHEPYLKTFSEKNNLEDLISISKIHVEPMGFYTKKDIKENDLIILPNDSTNEGRALLLLEQNNLITLKTDDKLIATIRDIDKNPLNLKFKEMDAAFLPRTYKEDESIAGAIINTNYAIEAGLNPLNDAIYIEDSNSPYANIIAIKENKKDDKLVNALIEVLTSEKTKKYILEKYNGAVVPVF
ncbi:MetQ/NlpA family ABC transporter substrate-binding protein [Oceanotoga sp. DSM 15011]|jgi:D-methionine transport system substrate-binding protein|uniref:MetQ/NlpA family ABC transporter substrate-binding protein n=1 Tax=Oceanotoga TaxID=1255275 RepID=UPI0021F4C568|nr:MULTISPECIES: MetQ/NlpA family ABC transporter substrate-binding protein [Oceanotoga]MDO7977088.1 MetQ/NlpA family ABC transporter substrate-binding protein [Oceanotoga teriensis]UYO99419.1 MetQ/NlpA family ABC transporter substrate-binding protein [Oceanotoga sp. DSM 15011]